MIVPADRLLYWVAFAGIPLTTAIGALPAVRTPGVVALAALGVLLVVDAAISRRRLDSLRITIPSVLRLSVGCEKEAYVELRGLNDVLAVQLAPQLPPELGSSRPVARVELSEEHPSVRLKWPILGKVRGRHLVSEFAVQCKSRLGFWRIRRSMPSDGEVRVYPNLSDDRRVLASHFLRRGGVGAHTQRQIGKGREYEKLREYLPGDSLDDIHWKASAKRGQPVTKEYQIERTQEVFAIVDTSRLSMRVRDGQSDLERRLRAAMILALATRQYGDLFGLIVFSDQVRNYLPARAGRAHFDACREVILTQSSRSVSPDFNELATFIRLRLRRRALLVCLTDLDDPALAEDFVRASDLVGRHHLVLATMLKPDGAEPIFSLPAEDKEEVLENLAGHLRWHRLQELAKVLRPRGVTMAMLEQESMASEIVSRYVAIKQRQIL